MSKKQTAEERALAAIRKHGSLVRDKHWAGSWWAPGSHWSMDRQVCGSVTIRKLERRGLVRVNGGVATFAGNP